VEGHIDAIDFDGDEVGSMRRKIMQITRPLLQQKPLQKATFERVVQLLRTLPGMQLKLSVPAPKTTDGATTLKLAVKRKKFDFGYGVDFNHPGISGILSASTYGLTPLGETIRASVMVPYGDKDQEVYALSYSQMPGVSGLQMTLRGLHFTDDQNAYMFSGLPFDKRQK